MQISFWLAPLSSLLWTSLSSLFRALLSSQFQALLDSHFHFFHWALFLKLVLNDTLDQQLFIFWILGEGPPAAMRNRWLPNPAMPLSRDVQCWHAVILKLSRAVFIFKLLFCQLISVDVHLVKHLCMHNLLLLAVVSANAPVAAALHAGLAHLLMPGHQCPCVAAVLPMIILMLMLPHSAAALPCCCFVWLLPQSSKP